jgi:probable HAF family extracellular repeat protein
LDTQPEGAKPLRNRASCLSATCLLAVAGCGGGNGVGTPAVAAGGGANLRIIVNRTYRAIDLGKLTYALPGWLLSPGANSIAMNDAGDIVSGVNETPYLWTVASPTLLDGRFKSARAINSHGQIAGDTWRFDRNGFPTHAGVWQNGAVTDLDMLIIVRDDNHFSEAFGINEAGQVVGEFSFPPFPDAMNPAGSHAVTYVNGVLHDIGTVGGTVSRAMAVNSSGRIVGYGTTQNNAQTHAISWDNSVAVDLGTLPGGTYSQATALNDAGQIVGFANVARTEPFGTPPPRAVLWQHGGIIDLGTLGGPGAYATGISKNAAIVGSAETSELRASDRTNVGYYYDYFMIYGYGWYISGNSPAGPQNSGGGAGFAGGGNGRSARTRAAGDLRSHYVAHAFVYADGTMFDLNKLLPANSDWELTQAHAINARGQIAGIGTWHGQVHGYLLDPN